MTFKLEPSEQQRTAIGSVVEVLLYPSFGAPLVLLWAPYGESEVSWGRDGDLKDVCASGNICSCTNEAGFTCSRTCVHGRMIICPVSS